MLAKRLRRYTAEANDALIMPEFFDVCVPRSFITIFFVIFYVSSWWAPSLPRVYSC